MKHSLLVLLLGMLCLTGFSSCHDNCKQTITYRTTVPFNVSLEDLRKSVKSIPVTDLTSTGKIYVKGNYLFINELRKGIHIIDNTNTSSPVQVAFIQVPGNSDMAVYGNILYADSYLDFVAIDISNPTAVKEVGRVQGAFKNGQIDGIYWYFDTYRNTVVDYQWKTVIETREVDCDGQPNNYYWGNCPNCLYYDMAGAQIPVSGANNASLAGTAGSTARFAIDKNRLYAISQGDEMLLFNINSPNQPVMESSVKLGFGIETIFPYKDHLFVGTTTGLQIWNNLDPKKPYFVSRLEHARACDPVVVENDIAYVTLRSVNNFGRCGAAVANQLDVIDVSVLSNPVLKKSYEMENPYGLGIDKGKLFICEGNKGLKYFNASNPMDVKLLQQFKNIDAYDVIPLNNTLMLIGKDGLYQYDYSNTDNLKLISKIPVKSI